MTQIVALAGKKGSGKNTIANFLHGHVLKLNEIIEKFEITNNGELLVNTHYIKEGELRQEMGILDLLQQNEAYINYADQMIWPFIKLYHFADPLKELCCGLFGMTFEQVYGNRKNTNTKINWLDMPGTISEQSFQLFDETTQSILKSAGITPVPNRKMTAREVMQYLGTEIFRKINNDIWATSVVERIKTDSPLIAVVADCRFDNEALKIKDAGGKIIFLNRTTEEDAHSSENGFYNTVFDLNLDNQNMTINESCENVLKFLIDSGLTAFSTKVS